MLTFRHWGRTRRRVQAICERLHGQRITRCWPWPLALSVKPGCSQSWPTPLGVPLRETVACSSVNEAYTQQDPQYWDGTVNTKLVGRLHHRAKAIGATPRSGMTPVSARWTVTRANGTRGIFTAGFGRQPLPALVACSRRFPANSSQATASTPQTAANPPSRTLFSV